MKNLFYVSLIWLILPLSVVLYALDQNPPGFSYIFLFFKNKEKEELYLKIQQPFVRIDRPKELFSVVYNQKEDLFLGMEHRDGRYWKFSWSQIQKQVEKIKESSYNIRRDPFIDPTEQSIEEILNPSFFPHYGRFDPFSPPPQRSWTKGSGTKISPFGQLFQWIGKNEKTDSTCWIQPLFASEADEWNRVVPVLRKTCQILSFILGENAWPFAALDIWASLPPKVGFPVETQWREDEQPMKIVLQKKEILLDSSWTKPPKNYLSEELPILEEYKNQ
ncbi:hypothetical protein [Methylacidiphilum caldifontis]|uniref:Uncharacterized protein n=1 Tax=Methylacidiphilum caldifontis TaxID=2795386 RepID=A0A4Y8PHC1_9BACT|nr:hypothetical protein [Methylacidiphilum caldifontis]TFE73389.1 hypothetical protein A7Q10_00035 [Methylacidiphilum caldifontis]